jgi:hypothetical protein
VQPETPLASTNGNAAATPDVRAPFSQVPWAAMQLPPWDYKILGWLYGRENHRTHRVEARIESLADGIGWEASSDALYRRVAGLRKAGWFEYRAAVGRRGGGYLFTLKPDHGYDVRESSEFTTADTSENPDG